VPLELAKRRNIILLVVAVAGIGLIAAGGLYRHQVCSEPSFYKVLLDGQEIGYVKDKADVLAAYNRLRLPARDGISIDAMEVPELEFEEEVLTPESQPTPSAQLTETIRAGFATVSQGAAILVDGKQVVLVSSEAVAHSIIEEIVDEYEARLLDGMEGEIEEVKILENVRVESLQAQLDQLVDREEAKKILLRGTTKEVVHEVKRGESLWTIAKANHMTVADVEKANPDVKPKTLQIGQELSLVVPDPYITIQSSHTVTYDRSIRPRTKVEYDSSMWPWQSRVKQAGESGTLRITERIHTENGHEVARETISRETIKDPVLRIVVKGNKVIPDHGTGHFMWPVDGSYPITSGFGWRWSGWHNGIDIGAPRGTPVKASDSGVITYAAWSGNYGKLVKIDHGGGKTVTYYAHLSTIDVAVGQQVERGQVIGKVGNTGRSTGPHLHFEIRLDGSPVNPISVFQNQ